MSEIMSSRYRIYTQECSILVVFFPHQTKNINEYSVFLHKNTRKNPKVSIVLTTCLTEEIIIKQDYYYCYNFQQKPNVTIQQGFLRYPIEDFSTQLTLLTHMLRDLHQYYTTKQPKEWIKLVTLTKIVHQNRNHQCVETMIF